MYEVGAVEFAWLYVQCVAWQRASPPILLMSRDLLAPAIVVNALLHVIDIWALASENWLFIASLVAAAGLCLAPKFHTRCTQTTAGWRVWGAFCITCSVVLGTAVLEDARRGAALLLSLAAATSDRWRTWLLLSETVWGVLCLFVLVPCIDGLRESMTQGIYKGAVCAWTASSAMLSYALAPSSPGATVIDADEERVQRLVSLLAIPVQVIVSYGIAMTIRECKGQPHRSLQVPPQEHTTSSNCCCCCLRSGAGYASVESAAKKTSRLQFPEDVHDTENTAFTVEQD